MKVRRDDDVSYFRMNERPHRDRQFPKLPMINSQEISFKGTSRGIYQGRMRVVRRYAAEEKRVCAPFPTGIQL